MTQQGLAEHLGVTQQAVSSWLRGVTRPNYETRMKIEELLGVPLADWEPSADGPADPPSASDSGNLPEVSSDDAA